MLWTHNDAHNPPELFAVNGYGRLIQSHQILGAKNRDWEDITLGEDGLLYILDNTSNNDAQHRSIIYVVDEPGIGQRA